MSELTVGQVTERLEELRALINAEPPERGISQGEILELESLAEHIEPDDVELLQWAGVPEFGRGRRAQAEAYAALHPEYVLPEKRPGDDEMLPAEYLDDKPIVESAADEEAEAWGDLQRRQHER